MGRARGFERCLAHLRSGVDHHELGAGTMRRVEHRGEPDPGWWG